jgi:integrase
MVKNAATHPASGSSFARQPADSRPALAPIIEINVRHIGRVPQPEKLTGSEAPEGWIRKVDRPREGKVWVGFFHLYVADPSGTPVRRKKEKTLGPATMPKHEAQQKLGEYIEKYTGKLVNQGESIETFAQLWKAFSAVKAGSWGKKMREDMQYLFNKHVLPVLGQFSPRKITLTPLQLLINKMAEDGYAKSTVKHVRTYLKACFEYAIDEDLVAKNPARKLALPNIRKKPCERFLSVEEVQALLNAASSREHLVLRIYAVCGLRPGEALSLRIDDFEGDQLRIDEALKERQLGEDRFGDTKTDESDSYVPVPPDLSREIAEWIAVHPHRGNPRAFLFLNRRGTAFSVGNYLKKQLKPLAKSVGILDLTQQAFRRTSSTHIQKHGTVKDMQRHLRHSDPETTLKHYAKAIPESLRTAVAALDAQIIGTRDRPKAARATAKPSREASKSRFPDGHSPQIGSTT